MERLTYRDKKGEAHLHCYQMCADAHEDCDTSYEVDRCQRYVAFRKLADYEDAEEQGLLLRLPCKVGDTVYCIFGRYTKCTINNKEFDEYGCQGCQQDECDSKIEKYIQDMRAFSIDWIVTNLKNFGKTVFLTREEAEAKLKEMESSALEPRRE